MKFATLCDTVDAAIEDQEEKVNRALYKLGWSRTSSFPDSTWRWTKKRPDGSLLIVNRSDAISYEKAISYGMSEVRA